MSEERKLIRMPKTVEELNQLVLDVEEIKPQNMVQVSSLGFHYCSDPERAFLNAIKRSYLRFRKEYYNTSEDFEVDDPVGFYLTFNDDILEGDDLLIDDLEHVVRAWEEELNV